MEGMAPCGQNGQVTDGAGTCGSEAMGVSDGGAKKGVLKGPEQNVLLGLGPPG